MRALNGTRYRGRDVRCNDADDPRPAAPRGRRGQADRQPANAFSRFEKKSARGRAQERASRRNDRFSDNGDTSDWRQFFKDDEPDFSEEGWARRKPKKR